MDLQKIGLDLFNISPLLGVLGIIAYVLWNNYQKVQAQLLETLKAHSEDRKESQEKFGQIVSQNTAGFVQMSGSVDNLSKAVTESENRTTTRLLSLEDKVTKNGRVAIQRATAKA